MCNFYRKQLSLHISCLELMFVICWMLHAEVDFRAKLKDVLKYPWFARHVDITNYDYSVVLGEIGLSGVLRFVWRVFFIHSREP